MAAHGFAFGLRVRIGMSMGTGIGIDDIGSAERGELYLFIRLHGGVLDLLNGLCGGVLDPLDGLHGGVLDLVNGLCGGGGGGSGAAGLVTVVREGCSLGFEFGGESAVVVVARFKDRRDLLQSHLAEVDEVLRRHLELLPLADDGGEARLEVRWVAQLEIALQPRLLHSAELSVEDVVPPLFTETCAA